MLKKSTIREIIKKIPFSVSIYHWVIETLPYLFYRKPEVLIIQGSKMYLNVWESDKNIRKTFRVYARLGIHEPITTHFIQEILKERDIFIDLGANIGYFSMLAARAVGAKGQVFSFEPEERNFKYLTRNKELNNYSQMKPLNMAVSNKKGRVKLYICPYDTGHHTIQQAEGITSYTTTTALSYEANKISYIEIETITLDEFLTSEGVSRVDFIKMDVEGAELLALQGMDKTIKRNENIKMIIEFFPLLLDKMESSPREFLRMLSEKYGFQLYEIADDYSARKTDSSIILKKITDREELMRNYTVDRRYHINLFAIKTGNKDFKAIISQRS